MKDRINLTITALDHKLAGSFTSNENCLLGTALRRRGYKNFSVTPAYAYDADRNAYRIEPYFGSKEACWDMGEYGKGVIGKKVSLILE